MSAIAPPAAQANKVREEVIERLLEYARLMRRKDKPAEAQVALEYEQQFTRDLEKVKAEAKAMIEG